MKYIYTGPASGLTLACGTEVLLWPGHEVALPESELTAALQAQGYLQVVQAVQAVKAEATDPAMPADEPVTKKRKEV